MLYISISVVVIKKVNNFDTQVGLVNRIFSAVKMFQPIPVNGLTDGETCFQIYHLSMYVSMDLVLYKGPLKKKKKKNQLPKRPYIDTNSKDRNRIE